MRNLLLAFGLVLLRADASLQDVIATQTTFNPTGNHHLAPSPTNAPLRARANTVDSNICGYFMGTNYWAWYYNNPATTCFWNSDAKIVGADAVPKTKCVDGEQLSISSCSTCLDEVQCSSTAPYCGTFYYSDDYSAYICTSDTSVTFQLQPTWSGMTDVIAFPIFTGKNGISTGTQSPLGSPLPTHTEIDAPATPSDSAQSNPNSLPSSNPQSTSDSTPSSSTSSTSNTKSTPVGAIVGGVIGGLALVGIFALAVIFFVIRSRRQRQGLTPSHQLPQNGFGNSGPTSLPPMQAYNQQPGFAQGGLAPHLLPNQHSFQQPEQSKPGPDLLQQPTQPELDSRNQPVFSQQHPVQPELDSRGQTALSHNHPVQGELDSNTPSNVLQGAYQQNYQPSQAELEHPNRGPQQLRGSSVLYEAP
ncbi:hypothetical protein O988_05437 [Pseudogymnoascus sp. VKM F-3808]|nr:hypothetical protein O988_05437 [Pseudogymnoascus sp. VKM F-3808]